MKVEHADYYSAGDLVELANLIAERDALKAELAAIKQGAGEPAAWANLGDLISAKNGRERYGNQGAPDMHTWSEGGPSNYHDTPLYTRPAAPLTDESELLEALKRLSFAAQTTGGVAGRDEGLCAAIDAATAVITKVVTHIKGAKG